MAVLRLGLNILGFAIFAVVVPVARSADDGAQQQDLYKALLEVLRDDAPHLEPANASAFSAESIEYFEKNVRPILAERCVECHGAETQKSGLRLDSRAAVLLGGENGPAITPGDPNTSRLAEAIRRTGEIKMPPDAPLPDAEIEVLLQWITMGAPWPNESVNKLLPKTMDERLADARANHWAFQPVRPPDVSDSADESAVDRIVRARLDAEGLAPVEIADRRTLIRRLSFDLIGLPPTFEEVEAFVNDESTDAYANLVDRLLASPRFGERWGRYWLDIARYSDTKGYVFQEERNYAFSHTYRDYVIRAYNEDLPYDQFIVQQIAADKLELGDDKRPLAAMGYLTLGRRFIGVLDDIIDDRIDVVTRGFMGLTVTCARCHDHKYDPIPAADYYSLYGVFRSSNEPGELPLIETPNPDDPEYQDYERKLLSARNDLDAFNHRKYVEFSEHVRSKVADYLRAAYDARDMTEQANIQELAKERELHWQLIQKWRDFMKAEPVKQDAIFGAWAAAAALPAETFDAELSALLANWVKDDSAVNPLLRARLKDAQPASVEALTNLYGELFRSADNEWLQRIAAAYQIAALTEGTQPELPTTLPDANLEAFRQKLYGVGTPANVPKGELEQYLDIPTRDRVTQLRVAIQGIEATHPGRPDRAMIMNDGAPFDPYVFLRGKPENRGDSIPRRFVEVLSASDHPPFAEGSGRLELARAIASPDNPLTARVYVNRVWMHLFDRPLVDSPSDFGLRSEPPDQPELLDYLAAEFVADGWSTKRLIKTIVTSDTYRRSSVAPAGMIARDPENRLLARQNRKRLDFEALRDSWLVASNSLDTAMGGPSVEISEPPFSPRRTVYSRIERQNLPALFRTFDFASPDVHSPARYYTTVPQQALFMMNSPFVVQQARSLVQRSEVAASDDVAARIASVYGVLYQRAPSQSEIESGRAFIDGLGEAEPPEGPPPSPWQYGYGKLDSEKGAVTSFTPLPFFGDGAWKGGASMPDPTLGWVSLHNHGGHPGGNADHAAIRRWIAPYDALIEINGRLKHEADQGDGVIGYIAHNAHGVLWTETVFHDRHEAELDDIRVAAGDTIDFVVAPGTNESFDSFEWMPHVSLLEAADASDDTGSRAIEWHAQADFSGPPPTLPEPLTPWEAYAQVLLLANEFVFVD